MRFQDELGNTERPFGVADNRLVFGNSGGKLNYE